MGHPEAKKKFLALECGESGSPVCHITGQLLGGLGLLDPSSSHKETRSHHQQETHRHRCTHRTHHTLCTDAFSGMAQAAPFW